MPEYVNVPIDQLRAMEASAERLRQLESDRQADEARAMFASGRAADYARAQEARVQQIEASASKTVVSAELNKALATQPVALVPGAVDQLTELWIDECRTTPGPGGRFAVQTHTHQPLSEFVAQKLGSEEYRHFRQDAQPTAPAASTTPIAMAASIQPQTLGEFALRYNAQKVQERREALAAGNPALDPSKPFGLTRR